MAIANDPIRYYNAGFWGNDCAVGRNRRARSVLKLGWFWVRFFTVISGQLSVNSFGIMGYVFSSDWIWVRLFIFSIQLSASSSQKVVLCKN
jgi:hypothetical protein